MLVIHSGGVNARLNAQDPAYVVYGYGNYFMLQIRNKLLALIRHNQSIAICVAAKPDRHFYDDQLAALGFNLADFIILGREDQPDWQRYNAVLILGGETRPLHEYLDRTGFDPSHMPQCQLIAGDSAGAYVLASKILLDYRADGSWFEIVDGFIPDINGLVAAHTNNSYYHRPGLDKKLRAWCDANQVAYLPLKENQTKEHLI